MLLVHALNATNESVYRKYHEQQQKVMNDKASANCDSNI